jgi:hypothetical protein
VNTVCTTAFYTSAITVPGKLTVWPHNPRNLLF